MLRRPPAPPVVGGAAERRVPCFPLPYDAMPSLIYDFGTFVMTWAFVIKKSACVEPGILAADEAS
jgi:hypothetical protein